MLSRADFEALFDTFTRSAWRLETQPAYDEPEEREPLRRWLAGEPDDLAWMADWWAWIRDITRSGKRFGRVRVLYDPPSDYQRFELGALTSPAVQAGEDIRILPVARARELNLPDQDFWLFDDSRVAVLHFGADGVAGAELIEDATAVRPFRHARDRAWDASVTYQEWAHENAP